MHSMTGFGKGESESHQRKVSVEISSVNRKQAEVVINLPKGFSARETELRKATLAAISRGRVSVSVQFGQRPGTGAIHPNADALLGWKAIIEETSRILGQPVAWSLPDMLQWCPECFLRDEPADEEIMWAEGILPAYTQALGHFLAMRRDEGAELAADLHARLDELAGLASSIRELTPAVPSRYRENLLARLAQAGLELDLADDRVLKEVALFADRCDTSEELTRLDCHIARFREFLDRPGDEPVGRSLDFLCQELHRELTTLGNKANDAEISHLAVSAKTTLEKIREQVQNVE